jgi:rhamnulokinase/L-fuculokinase
MRSEGKVLAFDLGASGGRAMLGSFDGERITIEEVHRFSNDPVTVQGTMYWDVLRLFHEIKQGLLKAKQRGGFDSISVDTWGVDFGLLDKEGRLLENPIHYRDSRTLGMMDKSRTMLDHDEFYQITGTQFMEINTVFQLLSLSQNRPDMLERADCLLMMPDLFHYMLTGIKVVEYSIATTTQLLDARARQWSERIIKALGLPITLFKEIVPCGTRIGTLTKDIAEELGIPQVNVVASAGHDTQSALVAVPATEEDFIFISCGTWSLFGTELREPLINRRAASFNITNEGGYEGKASFLKNIIGLWLIQESRRQWMREGKEYSFGELEAMGENAEPFLCFIDPDAPEFISAGNIPERIRNYCERTSQRIPSTVGEVARCINESIALKYRHAMEQLMECTGKEYDVIHIIGGGSVSQLLCQMTAGACNKAVEAGPIEATVYGNVALQLIAGGKIPDLKSARQIISRSVEVKVFEPKDRDSWDDAYERFLKIMG